MSLKKVYHPYFKIGAAVGEKAFGRRRHCIICGRIRFLYLRKRNETGQLLDEEENRRDPGA